jgi:hypothetical protein
VVWDREVQELVHDDIISQVALQRKKLGVEVQAPGCGAGSPLVPHGSYGERTDVYIEPVCPFKNVPFEFVLVAPGFHGLKLF